jgi:DNA-binding transcriptional LysR family regulator
MEFRQLSYFITAAQTQNFRKAAEICLVAQSALSRQIAGLEEELGVPLFERVNQRVKLTPAGQAFATYAKNILEELQNSQHAMAELKTGERGLVLLGCVEALSTNFFPKAFTPFHRQYPNIHVRMVIKGALELMKMVEEGQLDFGLVLGAVLRSDLLIVKELFKQPLEVALPVNHALIREKPHGLTLAEVAALPLLILSPGFTVRQVMEQIFDRHNLAFQPLVETDSVEGLKEMVKEGIGVTVMPRALIRPEQYGTELATLPISDLTDELAFCLVYHRTRPISRAAIKLLQAMTTELQPKLVQS